MGLLYLESFRNPRRFARIARRVGRRKPIVAVKSGRSAAGARASSSHTGALLAASDVTVDALFRQAGVIRTDTLHELFDVASLLANQPRPRGRRVGIVTNAGGPGILCADACIAAGLEVAELSEGLQARLAEELPAEASVGNPVDMLAAAPPSTTGARSSWWWARGGRRGRGDLHPAAAHRAGRGGQGRPGRRGRRRAGRAVLAVFMSAAASPAELRDGGRVIPCYSFPEDAARALGRAAEYGSWRERPEGQVPDLPGVRRDEAAGLLAAALAEAPDGRWLAPDQVAALLGCYGIEMAEWRLGPTPGEAAAAADELEDGRPQGGGPAAAPQDRATPSGSGWPAAAPVDRRPPRWPRRSP